MVEPSESDDQAAALTLFANSPILTAMSSVAEIEAAIERLSPAPLKEIAAWLESRLQETEARNGVPLLPSRGEVVTPERVSSLKEQESRTFIDKPLTPPVKISGFKPLPRE